MELPRSKSQISQPESTAHQQQQYNRHYSVVMASLTRLGLIHPHSPTSYTPGHFTPNNYTPSNYTPSNYTGGSTPTYMPQSPYMKSSPSPNFMPQSPIYSASSNADTPPCSTPSLSPHPPHPLRPIYPELPPRLHKYPSGSSSCGPVSLDELHLSESLVTSPTASSDSSTTASQSTSPHRPRSASQSSRDTTSSFDHTQWNYSISQHMAHTGTNAMRSPHLQGQGPKSKPSNPHSAPMNALAYQQNTYKPSGRFRYDLINLMPWSHTTNKR